MEIGIYLRQLTELKTIPEGVLNRIDWVVCGNYGCPLLTPATDSILACRRELAQHQVQIHYISPKVTQWMMDAEVERVTALLQAGVSVSINDWGLLYRLKPVLGQEDDLYLGRLLTKSLADWTWHSIYLGREEEETVDYFLQNNFNHQQKADYFSALGVKGIETNIHPQHETSFQRIQDKGLGVMGFASEAIVALSRSCPLVRLEGMSPGECDHLCQEGYQIDPVAKQHQEIYPTLELWGNLIIEPKFERPGWDGYTKLIYTWREELAAEL